MMQKIYFYTSDFQKYYKPFGPIGSITLKENHIGSGFIFYVRMIFFYFSVLSVERLLSAAALCPHIY